MPGHNCATVTQAPAVRKALLRVKKVWVPKRSQVVVNQLVTTITPTATQVNQVMYVTQSGADAGWKVATKRARHKGAPMSTSNTFFTLVEDDTDEESVEEGNEVHEVEGVDWPPDPLC